MLGAAWNGAIYAVGIVTIVFAILDHEKLRINVLDNWNPAKLPEPQTGRPIPRSETVIGPGVHADVPGLVDRPGARAGVHVLCDGEPVRFVPAPIWTDAATTRSSFSLIASVGIYLIDLVRPWRTLTVSAVDLAISLANVVDRHA